MYGGKVWGERPFCAQGVCVRGGWKGRAGGGGGKGPPVQGSAHLTGKQTLPPSGGNGPPVQGSALGKEGRKYGVGMGKNCPFMHGKQRCREVGKNAPNIEL